MHFNLLNWLFQDPVGAGADANLTGAEPFHFLWPWLIFCLLGLLIAFYYSVEGRKRFFKSRPILKYAFDRYLSWLAIICFIGLPMLAARYYLDGYFFAWRIWRYLWLLALVAAVVHAIVYFVRKFPGEQANFQAYQRRQQYIVKGKKRVKVSSR